MGRNTTSLQALYRFVEGVYPSLSATVQLLFPLVNITNLTLWKLHVNCFWLLLLGSEKQVSKKQPSQPTHQTNKRILEYLQVYHNGKNTEFALSLLYLYLPVSLLLFLPTFLSPSHVTGNVQKLNVCVSALVKRLTVCYFKTQFQCKRWPPPFPDGSSLAHTSNNKTQVYTMPFT